jgi:hypothetical protein
MSLKLQIVVTAYWMLSYNLRPYVILVVALANSDTTTVGNNE